MSLQNWLTMMEDAATVNIATRLLAPIQILLTVMLNSCKSYDAKFINFGRQAALLYVHPT